MDRVPSMDSPDRAAYDILLIGQSFLDKISTTTEAEIAAAGLSAGGRFYFKRGDARRLVRRFPVERELPGGSVPNTAAALSFAGKRVGVVTNYGEDPAGRLSAQVLLASGAELVSRSKRDGRTARC